MSMESQGYYFSLVPKYLQAKGFIVDKQLPHFSLALFISQQKIDQIAIVPVKEQKLYHTVFWLTTDKLQFVLSQEHQQWELARVQIHDESQFIGRYLRQLRYQQQHYHCEKVKISGEYQLQFQLFVAHSREELDALLVQYYGESDIKTPYTKQSQERLNSQLEFNIDNIKVSQSEIYSPYFDQAKESTFEKIDEEESINSSIPQAYPSYKYQALKIQLKQVEPPEQYIYSSNQLRKANSLTWGQTLNLYFFGLVSLVMVYFSMIPSKKI